MSNEPKQDAQPYSETDAAAVVDDNQMLNSDVNSELNSNETTVDASSNTAELQDDALIATLEARIKQLEDSLKLEKARTANAIYDTEKVKERLNREADTAKKFALEKFAKDLLNSVDNLERAIQAAGDESSALLDGVKLTHKSLLNTLEKFEVTVVDTQSGFNAELHQAVGIDPNSKAGEIANVLQQGYTLAGRLLRPAMVMVGQ